MNRVNKLAILMLIAAQLPAEEKQKLIHYAHAKHTGALHLKSALHLRQKTYPAHWVGPMVAT